MLRLIGLGGEWAPILWFAKSPFIMFRIWVHPMSTETTIMGSLDDFHIKACGPFDLASNLFREFYIFRFKLDFDISI